MSDPINATSELARVVIIMLDQYPRQNKGQFCALLSGAFLLAWPWLKEWQQAEVEGAFNRYAGAYGPLDVARRGES